MNHVNTLSLDLFLYVALALSLSLALSLCRYHCRQSVRDIALALSQLEARCALSEAAKARLDVKTKLARVARSSSNDELLLR